MAILHKAPRRVASSLAPTSLAYFRDVGASSCIGGKEKSPSPKLPPGRKGWPIIGETLIYGKACLSGNPLEFIAERMSRYAPEVFRTSLFGEDFAVLCGAAGNNSCFQLPTRMSPRGGRAHLLKSCIFLLTWNLLKKSYSNYDPCFRNFSNRKLYNVTYL
ncbi:Protopanaxadiol 6-hydroxylase [Morella rubra]|uniref:Protopanaxadiol 6-hydroxylase n=1 Tax=Morella rubra TaxID=262757 RepID=A0A6A1VIS6_9ROSI|nr:Protopanaxadiol 6-hydroxylase [Morella rubra]